MLFFFFFFFGGGVFFGVVPPQANFIAIALKPIDFPQYLKDTVGFARVDELGTAQTKDCAFTSGKGSARPIHACFKPG